MKRMIAIALLFLALPCLCACSQEKDLVYPISYHYLRAPLPNGQIEHGSADSLIGTEIREGDGYQQNPSLLLDVYLHGPLDRNFRTPFPVGTALRQLTVQDAKATVVLSQQFANLTGVDLSLACGCLTLTVMDLTGAESVTIISHGALLDGKESITMDRTNLILVDNTTPDAE